jgi:hypothetical protein
MRILDLFNQQYYYPWTWNFDDLLNAPKDLPEAPKTLESLNNLGDSGLTGTAGSGLPTNSDPTNLLKYKTEKGLVVHGIRNTSGNRGSKNGQPGRRSYLFVIDNSKP